MGQSLFGQTEGGIGQLFRAMGKGSASGNLMGDRMDAARGESAMQPPGQYLNKGMTDAHAQGIDQLRAGPQPIASAPQQPIGPMPTAGGGAGPGGAPIISAGTAVSPYARGAQPASGTRSLFGGMPA